MGVSDWTVCHEETCPCGASIALRVPTTPSGVSATLAERVDGRIAAWRDDHQSCRSAAAVRLTTSKAHS